MTDADKKNAKRTVKELMFHALKDHHYDVLKTIVWATNYYGVRHDSAQGIALRKISRDDMNEIIEEMCEQNVTKQ